MGQLQYFFFCQKTIFQRRLMFGFFPQFFIINFVQFFEHNWKTIFSVNCIFTIYNRKYSNINSITNKYCNLKKYYFVLTWHWQFLSSINYIIHRNGWVSWGRREKLLNSALFNSGTGANSTHLCSTNVSGLSNMSWLNNWTAAPLLCRCKLRRSLLEVIWTYNFALRIISYTILFMHSL